MESQEVLHLPVFLQKLQKGDSKSVDPAKRTRAHYGMVYFPEGTTANQVCIYITERQRATVGPTGLWLLQARPASESDILDDDSTFENIKDSKYQLKEGMKYVALYYTGPDIFLIQP